MTKIRFNYADIRSISLPGKKNVKKQIEDIFLKERKVLERLDYIFCSDTYLLEINQAFLHHDYYTDIITFDLSEGKGIVGEIYISVDRVRENAVNEGEIYQNELLRVIFHGALHLCGYADKRKSEIVTMRQKEDYYLQLLKEKN